MTPGGKKLKILLGSVLAVLFCWIGTLYFFTPNTTRLNFVHRFVLSTIVIDWEKLIVQFDPDDKAIVPIDTLLNTLSFWQKPVADKILALKPEELNVKGSFVSLANPSDLVRIASLDLIGQDSIKRETGVQFLPATVYNAYLKMNEAFNKATGKKLIVDSGYRSPGRQCFLYFYYLKHIYDYSLLECIKWIMMPGYSEHGSPDKTAIDFSTQEGINGFSRNQTAADFIGTIEYGWLQKNAENFGFVLSYPEHNPGGHAFEPWHWHYTGGTGKQAERTEVR